MVDIGSHRIPKSPPLDLAQAQHPIRDLWTPRPLDFKSGDIRIDYPFVEPWQSLGKNTTDPQFAADVKARLEEIVNGITREAVALGLQEFRTSWILTELLTNATQYGSVSEDRQEAGHIRFAWEINAEPNDPSLRITISNPLQRVFDPGRYANMTIEQWLESQGDGGNGHVGTTAIASMVRSGSEVIYLWELANGDYLRCSVRAYLESDPDRPAEDSTIIQPLRITAERFSATGDSLPYSYLELKSDIAVGLEAKTVTISCVIGRE